MTIWRRWIPGGASAPARVLAGRFVPGGASALASPPAPGFPKKYTPKGRFRHKNRGIPRGVRRGGRALVSDGSVTWRFFSKVIRHLAAASREGASFVGYLGFCAGIAAIRRTFFEMLRGKRPGVKDPAQRNLASRMPAKGTCLLASNLPSLSEGASSSVIYLPTWRGFLFASPLFSLGEGRLFMVHIFPCCISPQI